MSTYNIIQELIGVIEQTKGDAEATREEIEEKKSRLDDMDSQLEEGVEGAETILMQLQDIDDVIQQLEGTVSDYENEF